MSHSGHHIFLPYFNSKPGCRIHVTVYIKVLSHKNYIFLPHHNSRPDCRINATVDINLLEMVVNLWIKLLTVVYTALSHKFCVFQELLAKKFCPICDLIRFIENCHCEHHSQYQWKPTDLGMQSFCDSIKAIPKTQDAFIE